MSYAVTHRRNAINAVSNSSFGKPTKLLCDSRIEIPDLRCHSTRIGTTNSIQMPAHIADHADLRTPSGIRKQQLPARRLEVSRSPDRRQPGKSVLILVGNVPTTKVPPNRFDLRLQSYPVTDPAPIHCRPDFLRLQRTAACVQPIKDGVDGAAVVSRLALLKDSSVNDGVVKMPSVRMVQPFVRLAIELGKPRQ